MVSLAINLSSPLLFLFRNEMLLPPSFLIFFLIFSPPFLFRNESRCFLLPFSFFPLHFLFQVFSPSSFCSFSFSIPLLIFSLITPYYPIWFFSLQEYREHAYLGIGLPPVFKSDALRRQRILTTAQLICLRCRRLIHEISAPCCWSSWSRQELHRSGEASWNYAPGPIQSGVSWSLNHVIYPSGPRVIKND